MRPILSRINRRPRLEPLEDRATPATFFVTNASSDDVTGSLARAIADANASSPDPIPDVIRFDESVFRPGQFTEIALTRALPPIAGDVTIQGVASVRISITRDQTASDFRLLDIAAGVSVELFDLRLAGGRDAGGGGIRSEGSLYLERCTVENNVSTTTGGGIDGQGTLTLIDTIVRGNQAALGGGIALRGGSLQTLRVAISGNQASEGGGLYLGDGPLTAGLTATTISGNTGAMFLLGSEDTPVVQLTSCTIAANTAGLSGVGGVLLAGSPSFGSQVSYRNTLFADNTGANVSGDATFFNSNGNNLSTDDTGGLTRPTDRPNADPMLRPLGDYGGLVPTHALLPGSPAIDAVASFELSRDARGVDRPIGAEDIGAFEAAYSYTLAGGDAQAAFTGAAFASPLVVRLMENGQPATGVLVTFGVTGRAAFDGLAAVLVNAVGLATAPTLVAGTSPGAVSVTATAGGSSLEFSEIVLAGPDTSPPTLSVGGDEFANVGTAFVRQGQVSNGQDEQLTVVVTYGDGTAETITVDDSGEFTLAHAYQQEGSYLVRVTLTDEWGRGETREFFVDVLVAGVPIDSVGKVSIPAGETATFTIGAVTVTYQNRGPLNASVLVAAVPTRIAEGLDASFFADRGSTAVASFDVRAISVNPHDVATITFRFTLPLSATGEPMLLFFNAQTGREEAVRAFGYLIDRANGTITFVLTGRGSEPLLTLLGGTVFTIAVPVAIPATLPIVVPVASDVAIALDQSREVVVYTDGRSNGFGQNEGSTNQIARADRATRGLGLGISGGNGSAEAIVGATGEAGPLRELPPVAPVLTDLPGVTLTPAGTNPAGRDAEQSIEERSTRPATEEPEEEAADLVFVDWEREATWSDDGPRWDGLEGYLLAIGVALAGKASRRRRIVGQAARLSVC